MKYVAKQIPFDKQESNFYYSDYGTDYIIFGNKKFTSYTNDIFDHMVNVFENGYLHEDIDNIPVNSSFSEYRKIIEDYFPIVYHDKTQYRETNYTDNEIDIIRYALKQYDYCGMFNQIDLIKQVLSVLSGKTYTYKEIHGTVQSEWNVIYYPEKTYTDDQIRTIETMYFNTGSEFEVYPENDKDDRTFIYVCNDFSDDEIKKELSETIDCKPEDIEIHHFTGYSYIANYD